MNTGEDNKRIQLITLPVNAIRCKPQTLECPQSTTQGLKSQIVLITPSQNSSVTVMQYLYISIV